MATNILLSRLRAFQSARDRLREARDAEFKSGRAVYVINERYKGYGLIVADETCPLDQIAVRLENGNTWWYRVEDCAVSKRDACPTWLQNLMRAEAKTTVNRLTLRSEVQP